MPPKQAPMLPLVTETRLLEEGTVQLVPASNDKIALVRIEDQPYEYELTWLFARVRDSVWIAGDTSGDLTLDDLSVEEVVPLQPGAAYPEAGRPFLIRDFTEDWVSPVRFRAYQLCELHGGVPPTLGASATSTFFYSDMAHPLFGTAVDAGVLATPGSVRLEGSVGLVLDATGWTTMERVAQNDLGRWQEEKHTGAGRDTRLLSAAADDPGTLLFRYAFKSMSKEYKPDSTVFDGPAALPELCGALVASGLEPAAWVEQFIVSSGMGPRTALAIELRWAVHTVYLLGAVDRLNLPKLTAAEHLARRILQIQRAVVRNPRAPDFEALEVFGRHLPSTSQPMRSPHFDKFVTEEQKVSAFLLKQHRLFKEEVNAQRGGGKAPAGPAAGGTSGGDTAPLTKKAKQRAKAAAAKAAKKEKDDDSE